METVAKKKEQVKVYEFRELGAEDIFLMTPIISKLGIKGIISSLPKEGFSGFSEKDEKGKPKIKSQEEITKIGMETVSGVVQSILENVDKCENELFRLLSKTSNLSEKQVRTLDFATFIQMVIDFVKKEEFANFMKAVSIFSK